MKKEDVRKLVVSKLKQDEDLIGYFLATKIPSFWWYFVIGPLLFLGVRHYYIGLTKSGIHFHKLTFWGKPGSYEFFKNEEIISVEIKKTILKVQIPLKFTFSNKRTLKIKAQRKGVAKIPKISDTELEHLKTLNSI